MSTPNKNVADVLQLGTEYLNARSIQESRLLCEQLLARLLRVPRLELTLMRSQELSEPQLAAMRRGLKRLREGEPVQYVTGETGFMEQVFKTDRRALIPRPETEELVRVVLSDKDLWAREQPAIVDVGTGSGCIVLSLAAAHPQARYLAVDTSQEAIDLARENADRIQPAASIVFFCGELGDVAEAEMFDAIVANLPYIPSNLIAGLPVNVRDFEPRQALDGGPDGLALIRSLVADASIVLKAGGRIFLEIGEEQGTLVRELLEEGGFASIRVKQDGNGRDRIVSGVMEE